MKHLSTYLIGESLLVLTCTCNKVKYIEASRYEQVEVTVDFILKHPAIIVASIWEMRCNQERKKWAQELYNSTCVKIPMVANSLPNLTTPPFQKN